MTGSLSQTRVRSESKREKGNGGGKRERGSGRRGKIEDLRMDQRPDEFRFGGLARAESWGDCLWSWRKTLEIEDARSAVVADVLLAQQATEET